MIAHWRENNQQQLFFEYGARWNVIAETEFFSTACELVSAGCGVGIVDPVVSAPFAANVVRRPFVPKINYEIAVLYPTNEELSQLARDFVSLAIPFAGVFPPFEEELRDPRHWIAPAHCLYLLMRRFDRCCVLGVAQCLDYPLRDSPHIVLAHSARGARWRTKAQSTWA